MVPLASYTRVSPMMKIYVETPAATTSEYKTTYEQASHSLSVLGWYIPGLSGLSLGNRLLLLLAGTFQRLFVYSLSLCTFSPFSLLSSFVSCACVYSEHGTARVRGTVAGQRMVAGTGGLQGARSPFSWLSVACASRHEGCMKGLCLFRG